MSSVSATNLTTEPTLALDKVAPPSPTVANSFSHGWAGFRWAFVGNLIYAASQWCIYIVLARLGTPELVGHYALALAIAGPVVFVSNLQLRAIQASDASREFAFADFWCLRLMMAPLALLTIAAIAFYGGYSTVATAAILLMGFAKVVESLSDVCFGAIQRDNRLDLVGKSLSMKGILSLVAMGGLIALTGDVAASVLGLAACWLILFYKFDLRNLQRCAESVGERIVLKPHWNWSEQRRLVTLGLPMGLSMGLLSLTVGLPNILIERNLGERQVGIFAALASLTWAGLPLINAMGQTALPRLGQLFVCADKSQLRRVVFGLATAGVAFGAAGVVAVWAIGEWIVTRIYGAEYAQHIEVLLWLMTAAAILYGVRFLADALTAMRCVRVHLLVQALAAAVVLCGGLYVVPTSGMLGMAKVLVLAFSVRGAILLACFCWRTGKLEQEAGAAAT